MCYNSSNIVNLDDNHTHDGRAVGGGRVVMKVNLKIARGMCLAIALTALAPAASAEEQAKPAPTPAPRAPSDARDVGGERPPFEVHRGTPEQRAEVARWLYGLDLVSPATRERIITAWVSVWLSSPYKSPDDFPSSSTGAYDLKRHINEVARVGLDLARRAEQDWGVKPDLEILIPTLLLHDVDKPLLYVRKDGKIVHTPLSRQLPHGVIGAMLLRDLGFDPRVVNTVATHAASSPFHGSNFEAYVLHYADFFVADHAAMLSGGTPYYQRPNH